MMNTEVEISIRAEALAGATKEEAENGISWIRSALNAQPEVRSLSYGKIQANQPIKSGEAINALSILLQIAPTFVDGAIKIIHEILRRPEAPRIEIIVTDRKKRTEVRFDRSVNKKEILDIAKKLRRDLDD